MKLLLCWDDPEKRASILKQRNEIYEEAKKICTIGNCDSLPTSSKYHLYRSILLAIDVMQKLEENINFYKLKKQLECSLADSFRPGRQREKLPPLLSEFRWFGTIIIEHPDFIDHTEDDIDRAEVFIGRILQTIDGLKRSNTALVKLSSVFMEFSLRCKMITRKVLTCRKSNLFYGADNETKEKFKELDKEFIDRENIFYHFWQDWEREITDYFKAGNRTIEHKKRKRSGHGKDNRKEQIKRMWELESKGKTISECARQVIRESEKPGRHGYKNEAALRAAYHRDKRNQAKK